MTMGLTRRRVIASPTKVANQLLAVFTDENGDLRNVLIHDRPDLLNDPDAAFTVAESQFATQCIAFIGDSITAGFPLKNYWPNTINVGIGGNPVADMTKRLKADVLDKHPRRVVICAGTTGMAPDTPGLVQDVVALATTARAAGVPPVLCTIVPWGEKASQYLVNYHGLSVDTVNARVLVFNASLRALATASAIPLADYHAVLVDAKGTQRTELFLDGLHPNSAGYDVLWPILKPCLDV